MTVNHVALAPQDSISWRSTFDDEKEGDGDEAKTDGRSARKQQGGTLAPRRSRGLLSSQGAVRFRGVPRQPSGVGVKVTQRSLTPTEAGSIPVPPTERLSD